MNAGSRSPYVLHEDLVHVAGRTGGDLVAARRRARALWRRQEPAEHPAVGAGREDLLDLRRAQDTYRDEGTRLDEVRAQRRHGRSTAWAPTVVVAHRHAWRGTRVATELTTRGVRVVSQSDQAADVVAATVEHQPDLVLVSDKLLGARVPELLARVAAFCPTALLAVQVDVDDDAPAARDAGACAVYSHRMQGPELALALRRLLPTDPPEVRLVLQRARERAAVAP